jgi:NAD(P)-dependent dehydrogenase (short-subunit alcohol dehydrogenase family)
MAASENPFDLSGRVCVVTGGNRGIGFGIAKGLARAGASISLWSRDEARNAESAEQLAESGASVHSAVCDVGSEESVRDAAVATIAHFGRIDVGIANAGFGANANPLELELDEWHRILRVNLDGVFLTFRILGAHMKEREGGGKLVAISSISAVDGTPLQPHYAASKGGLEAMVRSYAVSLARYDVQVNAVQPGWIATEATAQGMAHDGFRELVTKRTPARRWGEPDDMAGVIVYLASDASRFHTGDTLRVDGGYAIF